MKNQKKRDRTADQHIVSIYKDRGENKFHFQKVDKFSRAKRDYDEENEDDDFADYEALQFFHCRHSRSNSFKSI